MLAFKLFRGDLFYQYGDRSKRYPINQWTRKATPIICESGYHVSSTFCHLVNHLRNTDVNRLFIVDCKGKRHIDIDDDNKISFESIKLVKEIDTSKDNLEKLAQLLDRPFYHWRTQKENLSDILCALHNIWDKCEENKNREIIRKFFNIPKGLFYKNIYKNIRNERVRKRKK